MSSFNLTPQFKCTIEHDACEQPMARKCTIEHDAWEQPKARKCTIEHDAWEPAKFAKCTINTDSAGGVAPRVITQAARTATLFPFKAEF